MVFFCLFSTAFAELSHQTTVKGNAITTATTDVNLADYNGFTSSISREQFSDSLTNIPTLINQLPSVQTYSSGGFGSFSSASIRGSTGKQINVFIDGILLSSPLSGSFNLGVIPSSVIERIDIYPDYTPVELTDGNLAGAINIHTRNITQGKGGNVSAGFGSFDTQSYQASGWLGHNTSNLLVAASHSQSSNDFYVTKALFPNVSSGNSQHRENSAFKQNDLFTKYRYQLSDNVSLFSMLNYNDSYNEIATIQNKTEPAATLDASSIRASIGLENSNNTLTLGGRLYTQKNANDFTDIYQSIALQSKSTKMNESILGASLYLQKQFAKNRLSSSVDIAHTSIDKENQLLNQNTLTATRNKLIIALNDVWEPIQPLSFYALTRFYFVNDSAEKNTNTFGASCYATNKNCLKSDYQKQSMQLGSHFTMSKNWLLKANIAQQIRIPTLAEKFGELGNYIGDPHLKPEHSTAFDVGLQFNNHLLNAELIGFMKHIDNGIYIAYDARGVGHPSNINNSEVMGAEINTTLRITDEISFKNSAYIMDSENQSDIKANKGKKLYGIYHNGYVSSFIWCSENHTIDTNYQVDDDLYYTPANTVKAGKKTNLNISYSYAISHWVMNVGINNLFNKQYSDFNRMPSMGRFYNTQLSYQF